MNKFLSIFFLLLLVISCKERVTKPDFTKNINKPFVDSSYSFISKKFGLTYSENYLNDSNAIVFYCIKSFDSSFLIHFKKERKEIEGVYYVEMPTYRYNLSETRMDENHPSVFEGYRFTLDSIKWEIIKNKVEVLLRDTSFNDEPGVRDGSKYGLFYKFRAKIDNGDKFGSFYQFLKELFFEKFTRLRKQY